MVPVEVRGHSFKGLIKYLSAPKRGSTNQAPEDRRLVFTANMDAYKPRNAKEVVAIMAHLCREEVRRGLMEAAQVRGRSREINLKKKPVLHLVLAFPYGAEPEPKFVRSAVKEALSALEAHKDRTLADHQYAVFLHQDTEHWHVHVVVNLVDHHTGRLADPYRSQQKLQAWANDWCLRHGFNVCKDRQKKYEHIARNKQKSHETSQPYRDYDGYRNLNGSPHHLHKGKGQGPLNTTYQKNATYLKSWSARRYAKRKAEREALYQWRKAEANKIRAHFKPKIQAATALRRNPVPFTIDARQIQQRRQFFSRERHGSGRMINSLWIARQIAREKPGVKIWPSFLHYLGSPEARRTYFFRRQYAERKSSRRVQKIVRAQGHYMNKLKAIFDARKSAMDTKHGEQIAEERRAWSAVNKARWKTKDDARVGLRSSGSSERNLTPIRHNQVSHNNKKITISPGNV